MKTFTLEQADEDFFAVLNAAATDPEGLVEIMGDHGPMQVKCTSWGAGERRPNAEPEVENPPE
ncbi:MAG: hypothetical protein ACI8WB_004309 [Phenylobacterium sp.]|jgi:hypothetical protein